MAMFVPYLILFAYADLLGAPLSPWYITTLCITNIVSRGFGILGPDYTFNWNRILFVVAVVGGFIWIVFVEIGNNQVQ